MFAPIIYRPGSKLKMASLTFAAAVAAIGASASVASAGTTSYCNKLVGAGLACDVSWVYQHTQQNSAQYLGAGSVSVCQKLTVSGVNRNRTCGGEFTASPLSSWGEVRSWVGNDSANPHTINGISYGS